MDDIENKAEYLSKACSVDKGMAIVALLHTRGSIPLAKDFLNSETCQHIFGRQAREFNIS